MTMLPLLATALVLGAVHSFAPDHLAAVSVFVSRHPSWRRAMRLGAQWGLGHSLSILLVGGGLAVLGLRLPERFAPAMERTVGVVLILIGLLAMWRAYRMHGHWHEHPDGTRHWHLHAHQKDASHAHGHAALLGIGMLHGLAGSGALVVALPSAISASRGAALIFLCVFGCGTILSMSLFSAVAGHFLSAATRASALVQRGAISVAGIASVGVGMWWILSNGG